MDKKRALITGIKGQDGSYLAEFLLDKGYEVHGLVRRSEFDNPRVLCPNIAHLIGKIILHSASLENQESLTSTVESVRPDECYHFAAQSFVDPSPEEITGTLRTNVEGTLFLLEALNKKSPKCKFYFSGSSEMFGTAKESPQNEQTPFRPRNIYGLSKMTAYHLMRMYRERYNMFACGGILFNHESPRRGHPFVTRKITSAVARIASGSGEKLKLGDLSAKRDWGYSPDYVRAMWLMLQQPTPGDYVVASGETHTVEEFVEEAFRIVGLDWRNHVEIDRNLFREPDKTILCGDASKTRRLLEWEPSVSFKELVKIMVKSEMEETKNF